MASVRLRFWWSWDCPHKWTTGYNQGTPIFRTTAIYFYAGRDGLSLADSLGAMGVPLPFKLEQFLHQLNEKGDRKDALVKRKSERRLS
ncbi:phage holin family protein [Paenibacillus peoriae]|uniref:phage holin family protein n=1 Tax=Paenibacillus peoriae TaxID=59893 RepID=UPI001F51A7B0|nr:phage holin family protein [Paenibacillus peoriae]MEC0180311.1 phage holin family protein [Paenibacillus peoriae]